MAESGTSLLNNKLQTVRIAVEFQLQQFLCSTRRLALVPESVLSGLVHSGTGLDGLGNGLLGRVNQTKRLISAVGHQRCLDDGGVSLGDLSNRVAERSKNSSLADLDAGCAAHTDILAIARAILDNQTGIRNSGLNGRANRLINEDPVNTVVEQGQHPVNEFLTQIGVGFDCPVNIDLAQELLHNSNDRANIRHRRKWHKSLADERNTQRVYTLVVEQELHVGGGQPVGGVLVTVECGLDHVCLFLLQLDDPGLDTILDDQLDDSNWTVLSDSVDSVCGLAGVQCRVPPTVQNEHLVGLHQTNVTDRTLELLVVPVERVHILGDTDPAELVVALGLDRLLGLVVTELADNCACLGNTLGQVFVSLQNQVRMVCKLSHSGDQSENIGIIVKNNTLSHIVVELTFRVRVQRLIKVFLLRVEEITTDLHNLWWQSQIVGSLDLGSSKHDLAQ
ncbi:hypothetical protein OGAPHI_004964 [Ogataea philodendri]|uniref:Uncharacterized protein n=1 Tax=Ogataea philodendri TaxID=1378263 RepID=A0A9P8P0F6_9ASCO|nr:uncharacterized protein OGAPHI_004964 [Ogataea philodendri]KAH3663563.1 hypothetical protein OGAPHI_004964 [Ogataea philodendri]